jgi:hypothetical protein
MKNSNHITTLHREFVRLGRERNKITYKLLALLPKILEFEIYKKYNYSNIYEYAGKLAGLSHPVVEKTLRTHGNLEGKPCLQKAVESEGIHKVALVAKLATSDSDAAFADKVKNMSKHSLCELSKEVRAKKKVKNGSAVGDATSGAESAALFCNAAPSTMKIELDEEMQFLFLKLKKKYGNHLSNKEVLRKILKEMDTNNELNNKKHKMSENGCKCQCTAEQKGLNKAKKITSKKFSREKIKKEKGPVVKKPSRYIPAHQKRAAMQKSDGKCAYPGCLRPADLFHHAKRFSEVRDHRSITLLCKAHHEFAHNGLISNEEKSVGQWRLNVETGVGTYADAQFRACRRE